MAVYETSEILALCYAKQRWADAWVQVPLLECVRVGDQAAPGHATASFRYEYGVGEMLHAIGERPADSSAVVIPPLDLQGRYVRVVTPSFSWSGVVLDQGDEREADQWFGGAWRAAGVQTFEAFGLSILLDKMVPISGCVVVDESEPKFIGKAIPVNGGLDGRSGGDRPATANKATAGQYFADGKKESVELWNSAEFAEYLFRYFAPMDRAGDVKVPFRVQGMPRDVLPMFDYDGKTLWEILPMLASRQKGLGFNLLIDDGTDPETVVIDVWSYSPVNITLPNGYTVAANNRQTNLDLSSALNVLKEVVTESVQSVWDQVRVLGNYRGSVCSWDPLHQAVPGWTQGEGSEEEKYNLARSEDAGFDDLDSVSQIERNAEFRIQDLNSRVFSWWSIDGAWNRLVPDIATDAHYVFPGLQPDGSIITAVDDEDSYESFTWVPALRIAEYVPMLPGVDYRHGGLDESELPLPVTPDTAAAVAAESDFLKPAVWFRRRLAEHLDCDANSEDAVNPRQWSVSTRVRKDWPGMIFQVSGGLQHFIAKDLFESTGSYESITAADAALDHDSWVSTIYLQSQERVQAVYPPAADLADNDVLRVFEVDMSDAYLDILLPGTIVGLRYEADDYGATQVSYQYTVGGILRDDRVRMVDKARQIWQWIGSPRRLLDVSLEAVNFVAPIGTMYNTIGYGTANAKTVNTVVTSVDITLATGTTSFRTGSAELDVL